MSELKECCGIEDYLFCRCAEIDAIHANNARLESDNYDLRAKLSSLNKALIAAEAKVARYETKCEAHGLLGRDCYSCVPHLTPEPEGKP